MRQKSVFGDAVPLVPSANNFTGDVSEDFEPPAPPLRVADAPVRAVSPIDSQPLIPKSKLPDKQKEEATGGMDEVNDNNRPRSGYREPRRQVGYQNNPNADVMIDISGTPQRRDYNHSHDLHYVPSKEDSIPYNTIAEYMPEFEFRGISTGNKIILVFAVGLAIIASLYNAQFAGTFGSFISDAVELVWYLSSMAFLANVPINIRSIKMSADKVRTDLFSRWKPHRLPLPDDKQIQIGVVTKTVIAGIGAFPPMLFSIAKPLFGIRALANWGVYLILMGTQLIVVGAQNLRGITKDDDMNKQDAVFYFRERLLRDIADCLDGDIPDQLRLDIKSMAQGKFSAPSESKLKRYLGEFLGWSYFAYVGIHAAATGKSVYNKLKVVFDLMPVITPIVNSTVTTTPAQYIETGSVWYDGAIILIGTVATISFALRWLLLGRSAKGFVDSMFAMGNRSFFKMDDIEIIDSVFAIEQKKTRAVMQIVSVSTSVTVGVSSLGSASEIPHANFFNDSPEAGLIIASIGIGGISAGPINILDFKSLLDTLCGYLYTWGRSKGRNYNASDRFGKSRNEFLLKFMRIITGMSVGEFANRFLVTFNSSVQLSERERKEMGITSQQEEARNSMREGGLNGVGYARNSTLENLTHTLNTLRGGSPRLFESWKRGALPAEKEKLRHDEKVKLEAREAIAVEASPSPRLTRAKPADDSTPLVQDGGRHSINYTK